MQRALISLVTFVWASGAQALSCLPPDPVEMYNDAAASELNYLVVHGRFHGEELAELTPKTNGGYEEAAAEFEDFSNLTFSGKALTRNGFTHKFEEPITLRLSCIGPWCTGLPSDEKMLVFLEVVKDGYRLDINACGGFAMPGMRRNDLARVVRCHQGGACVRAPFE